MSHVPEMIFTLFLGRISAPGSGTGAVVIKMSCVGEHYLGHVTFGEGAGGRELIAPPVHTLSPCAVSQWLLYGRVSFVINKLLSASLENPPWLSPNNIDLLLNSCFWLPDFDWNQTLRWKHGKEMDGFSLGCIKRQWVKAHQSVVLTALVQGN